MSTEDHIPEAMIFDLDGTLFQTETLLLPAYHRLFEQLRNEGLYVGDTPDSSLILGSLGMLLADIWARVIPNASAQVHERANELLLQYQMDELRQGVGALYPDVKATLTSLKARGIRLFVASNGLEAYVKNVINAKGLDTLFEGLYSAGEFATKSKVTLVRMLLDEYDIQSAWMVGDRSSDVEAGKENHLNVIGCKYAAFGDESELNGADRIINAFSDLLSLITYEIE
jgi:phosphoglycolate phosphatase